MTTFVKNDARAQYSTLSDKNKQIKRINKNKYASQQAKKKISDVLPDFQYSVTVKHQMVFYITYETFSILSKDIDGPMLPPTHSLLKIGRHRAINIERNF